MTGTRSWVPLSFPLINHSATLPRSPVRPTVHPGLQDYRTTGRRLNMSSTRWDGMRGMHGNEDRGGAPYRASCIVHPNVPAGGRPARRGREVDREQQTQISRSYSPSRDMGGDKSSEATPPHHTQRVGRAGKNRVEGDRGWAGVRIGVGVALRGHPRPPAGKQGYGGRSRRNCDARESQSPRSSPSVLRSHWPIRTAAQALPANHRLANPICFDSGGLDIQKRRWVHWPWWVVGGGWCRC
jgi:hypothetical protein